MDAKHMVEPGGQQLLATAHLHGGTGPIIIEPNGQEFAIVPLHLGVAIDGHPDQAGLALQKFQDLGPCSAHHFDLRWLLLRRVGRLLLWLLLRRFGRTSVSLRDSFSRRRLLGDRWFLVLLSSRCRGLGPLVRLRLRLRWGRFGRGVLLGWLLGTRCFRWGHVLRLWRWLVL